MTRVVQGSLVLCQYVLKNEVISWRGLSDKQVYRFQVYKYTSRLNVKQEERGTHKVLFFSKIVFII